MDNINVIQLLTRFSNMITEIKEETNIVKHSSLLVLFLSIQFLVVVIF